MRKYFGFLLLSVVKALSHLLYKSEFKWINTTQKEAFDIRLIIFLNHTSLYEPIYIQAAPFSFLKKITHSAQIPGADITLNRPIVGRFWKLLFPNITTVTRKKDESWTSFIGEIKQDTIVVMAPEGRMKRPTGLDKYGKKMTVRGGAADAIERIGNGKMMIALSGGLHHVQAPGSHFPKIFKTIKMNFEVISIEDYLKQFSPESKRRKIQITEDLQRRLENDIPII